MPIFAWNVPLVSLIFYKGSLVFAILLFSSVFLHCSLKKAFLSLRALWNCAFRWYVFPFLLCLALLFSSQLFVRPPQTTVLPFCIPFSWWWFWPLPPVQCYKHLSTVLQALCLSGLIHWVCLSPPLYNHKGFDFGHPWMTIMSLVLPNSY